MHSDDPDLLVCEMPHRRRDSANQSRIAHGNVDCVDLRKLIDNLAADRRRARRQIRIGSIVQEEDIPLSFRVCRRKPKSFHQIRAVLHNFRAQCSDFSPLHGIRILWQKNRRPHAQQFRGIGHGRAVIARTRSHDFPHLSPRQIHRQRVQRATRLEGSGGQIGLKL